MKNQNFKYYILFGIGLTIMMIPLFHTNLWFDEAYSVGLSRYSFFDIWQIDSHDVHPPLYYFILHAIGLLTNHSIIAFRLFSFFCIIIFAFWAGYIIRKNFGDKHANSFLFFLIFTPVISVYSSELRMYTLVMAGVGLSSLYAYQIVQTNTIKDWIIFSCMNIAVAYSHYYGLLAIALMNLVVLYHLWKTQRVRNWFIFACIQIASYMPWLYILLRQMGGVKSNFWLTFVFPDSLIEMISFQVSGNLEGNIYIPTICVLLFISYVTVVSFRHYKKSRLDWFTAGIYLAVILVAIIVSLMMWRDIFYARYLLVITGIFLIWFSGIYTHFPTIHKRIIASILIIGSCVVNVILCFEHYDSSNTKPYEYLNSQLQEGDVILVCNDNHDPNSFIPLSQYNNSVIYYNQMEWSQESIIAYQAFDKNMTVIDDLQELEQFKGSRICMIYADDDHIGEYDFTAFIQALGATSLDKKFFETKYKNIEYTIEFVKS